MGNNLALNWDDLMRNNQLYNTLLEKRGNGDISTASASHECGFLRLHIPVSRRFTGKRNADHVVFSYSDLIDVAVGTLLDNSVVRNESDIMWRADLFDEDGVRRFTPNLNSGEWWLRSEKKYCVDPGSQEYYADMHILPLIIFIDDTVVVRRGTRSVKPVVLTLGNLRAEIRQTDVRMKPLCAVQSM